MIDLPRALEDWRPHLALFPDDVAASILPWIPRLAMAVGPLASKTNHTTGQPDGYGGLARRGAWERLLLSEWALALEHPDEFTRRAAMGEHLFLELARKEPSGSQRSAVLFDAGPSQLGAPRVAQLALLVVLARRAKAAGADFTWGILGRPDGWSYEHVSEASVLGLLEARSAEEPAQADLDDWLSRLGAVAAPDDLWIVGSRRLARFGAVRRLSRVEVEDVLEPGVRRVRVDVRRHGSARREVELELPEERRAVQLLRDPFTVRATAPVRRPQGDIGAGNLLWSRDGRKLFVRRGLDAVLMHHPPQGPGSGQNAGVTRALFATDERVVAAGLVGRDPFLVTSDGDRLGLRAFTRRGRLSASRKGPALDGELPVWHPGSAAPLQPAVLAYGADSPEQGVLFTDAGGNLFYLRVMDPREIRLLASGVEALGQSRRRPVFFGASHVTATIADGPREGGWAAEVDERGSVVRLMPELATLPAFTRAHLGQGGALADPRFGVAAVHTADGAWYTLDVSGRHAIEVPEGEEIVGVLARATPAPKSGLVTLGPDRRTFSFVTDDGRRELVSAQARVRTAAVCPTRAHVAWLDEHDELHVVSLDTGRALFRLLPAAGAAREGGDA